MHKAANKIIQQQILPTVEKMLNEGISEREFEALQNQVHLVKDMWEVHTMHHKDELRKEKDARHAEKKARKMMYKQSRMAHKMQFNDYK